MGLLVNLWVPKMKWEAARTRIVPFVVEFRLHSQLCKGGIMANERYH
jgi:hypothetical protein